MTKRKTKNPETTISVPFETVGKPFAFVLEGEEDKPYLCKPDLPASAMVRLEDRRLGWAVRFVELCLEPESKVDWLRRLEEEPDVTADMVDGVAAGLMRHYFGLDGEDAEGESED